jgi:hypothetical protein
MLKPAIRFKDAYMAINRTSERWGLVTSYPIALLRGFESFVQARVLFLDSR